MMSVMPGWTFYAWDFAHPYEIVARGAHPRVGQDSPISLIDCRLLKDICLMAKEQELEDRIRAADSEILEKRCAAMKLRSTCSFPQWTMCEPSNCPFHSAVKEASQLGQVNKRRRRELVLFLQELGKKDKAREVERDMWKYSC